MTIKQIQTPEGFFTVDSWNPAEQKYFSIDELPTAEEIAIRNAYIQAIDDINDILAVSSTPVIDTLPKAQGAIRQLIVGIQMLAEIEKKHLQYHKRGING
jgi:hypothetical protein